jgi:hypothetical protein
MSSRSPITLTLDRRLLEHPRAYHLRRMRQGIWLYLDLLARLAGRPGTLEVEPAAVGRDMGLPEGTIRSWLGHLRQGGYTRIRRLNRAIEVTVLGAETPARKPEPETTVKVRVKTPEDLARALGEPGDPTAFQAALNLYPKRVIERSLKAALAVPQREIRHSRTALFLYLLKHHDDKK